MLHEGPNTTSKRRKEKAINERIVGKAELVVNAHIPCTSSLAGSQLNVSTDLATLNYGAFNNTTLQDQSAIEMHEIGSPEMLRN